MAKNERQAVTIFLMGEFGMGVHRYEGWLIEHGRQPYAQYPAAPFVKFVPCGKRNPRGWQGAYKPYCVILKGHGLRLFPEDPFVTKSSTPEMTVQESKYTMFDKRWGTDFDVRLAEFLQANPDVLLADYRDRG